MCVYICGFTKHWISNITYIFLSSVHCNPFFYTFSLLKMQYCIFIFLLEQTETQNNIWSPMCVCRSVISSNLLQRFKHGNGKNCFFCEYSCKFGPLLHTKQFLDFRKKKSEQSLKSMDYFNGMFFNIICHLKAVINIKMSKFLISNNISNFHTL